MARRKKQCHQPFQNFLPNELIIEIMSRLPAKSLYRFKCVSKSWRSLISDPQFIKKHVRVLETEDSLERKRIILRYPFHGIKSCSLHSIYHEPFGYSIDHDYPSRGSYCRFKIVGTCNGLVCLCIKERYKEHILFLWNPCSGESIRIMEPSTVEDHRLAVIHYGFGYNQQLDDYMVAKMTILGAYKPQIKVYSLRGNSWRDVDGFPFEVHCIESSKYVGGTVNWGVHRCSDSTWNIVSLDLAKQRFLEIPHPDYGDGSFCPLLKVLEGCLCVLCDRSDVSVDVWMMKEYGVKESWVKMFTVPYAAELRPYQYPRTLCFLKYSGILMYFTRTLVLYDHEQRAFRYPMIYGVQDCHEADTYSESIVSPRVYQGIGFGNPNNY